MVAGHRSTAPGRGVAPLDLQIYRFTLRTLETLHLPGFVGHPLRGGWKEWHRRVAPQTAVVQGVSQPNAGVDSFGYLWRPTASLVGLPTLARQGFATPPLPLTLRPRFGPGSYGPDSRLEVELTLVGGAIAELPSLRMALELLGRHGLRAQGGDSEAGGRFRVERVDVLGPGGTRAIPDSDSDSDSAADVTPWRFPDDFDGGLPERAGGWAFTLEFVSPTFIGERGAERGAVPTPEVVVRSIVDDLTALGSAYGGGAPIPGAWRKQLLTQATTIRMIQSATAWRRTPWRSSVQRKELPWGGWTGRLRLAGDLEPLLPVLRVAELIHVGKRGGYGWGQVRLILE